MYFPLKLFPLRVVVVLAALALLLAACAEDDPVEEAEGDADDEVAENDAAEEGADGPQCEEPHELRYAFITPETSPYDAGGIAFADYLEEHAPGCFDFESFPDGQLGNELDIEQSIEGGAVQLGVGAQALQNFVPEAPLFMTPFLFEDRAHMEAVTDSELADEYAELVEDQAGFKVLGYFTAGDRHILSTEPVRDAGDLQGLSLRVPESQLQIDIWEELGANPVDLPFGDMYTGLQTGTVDAIELDPSLIVAMSLYEVTDYYTLTDHLTGAYPLIMDANFYDSLPEDLQQVIDEAGEAAEQANREHDEELIEEGLAELEELGVEVIEFDNTELREQVSEVYDQFPDTLPPDMVERIQELGS